MKKRIDNELKPIDYARNRYLFPIRWVIKVLLNNYYRRKIPSVFLHTITFQCSVGANIFRQFPRKYTTYESNAFFIILFI